MSKIKNVLVTGGAGYVGAVLVPKLLDAGYRVKVLDLYIYGEDVLDEHPDLTEVRGDIRDRGLLEREIPGTDAIVHLACISNDPSFELDPALGKSIGYDAFGPLVDTAKKNRVKRFVFASSSSVYGMKREPLVTEDLLLEPMTDYALYKVKCEEILLRAAADDFTVTIVRPGTVCGYSPRMRLDLIVNILTNHAINKGEITVEGGGQMRPVIHIEDMASLYVLLLSLPGKRIQRKIYNAGWENHSVMELARLVQGIAGGRVSVVPMPGDDSRSYRLCSRRLEDELGFLPQYTIRDAVVEMERAFRQGRIPGPLENIRYYNVKMMRAVDLR